MTTKTTYQKVINNICSRLITDLTVFADDAPQKGGNEEEQIKEARKAVALKLQKISIDILESI